MTVYAARQPILDASRATFGYELLYRSSGTNASHAPDRHSASLALMNDGLMLHGLTELLGQSALFINFDPRTLLNGYAQMLPAAATIIEVSADAPVDDDVLRAAQQLRDQGYRIACANVRSEHLGNPLLAVSDLVKVDVQAAPRGEWSAILQSCRLNKAIPVAEKVESNDAFQMTKSAGFRYFQGHFFAHPTLLQSADLPSSKSSQMMLLREVNRADVDFGALERALASDVGLAYKLLTLVNSATFGLRHHVESLRQAAVLLGEAGVRKWASVIIFKQLSTGGPSEQLTQSLIRAGFCDAFAITAGLGQRRSELYMMGLFSMLDAVLDRPMERIVNQLPLADDVCGALLGEQNEIRKLLEMVLAYEQANWSMVERTVAGYRAQEADLLGLYRRSVAQAQALLN
ncbi:MAG: EAL and HDOD domain-containing protein [Chloroflexota bacterium]